MSLNIKNEQTVELVRELARRTGLSQTSAVDEAVRAKLADIDAEQGRDARRVKVNAILSDLDRSVPRQQRLQIRREQDELYDENGLPV